MIVPRLKQPLIFSAISHGVVLILFLIVSSFSWRLRSDNMTVAWVELPRGTSQEIESNMRKAKDLPKTTIQEQKIPVKTPEQKPLPPVTKKVEPPKPKTMPQPVKPAKNAKAEPKKPLSATDKKIADALKSLDKKMENRGAVPEAAQVKDDGAGYEHGLGDQPLRVPPSDPEYVKYQAEVRHKIISQWIIPPRYTDDEEIKFNAQVEVIITTDGEIGSTRWERHSGNAAFDASVIRAIQRAAPLPKPPPRLEWEAYNEGFLIEFDPRLKAQ